MNKQHLLKLSAAEIFFIVAALILMIGHTIYCNSYSPSRSVILLSALTVVALVSLLIFYFFLKYSERSRDWVFLAALIGMGLFFCFLFPPGTVPDELHHFESAYLYANGLATLGTSTLDVRADDAIFISEMSRDINQENFRFVASNIALLASNTDPTTITTVSSFPISGNPPQVRLAAALGIFVGKLFGLSSLITFYLGRLFNLASYIAMAFVAYRITPVGKNVFVAIALLPMSLHLAASYSYDPAIMGFAFIFLSLLFKCIYQDQAISHSTVIAMIVFAILLAPCKSVYSLVILLVFLIPNKRFTQNKYAWLFKGGVLLGAALAFWFISQSSITGITSSTNPEEHLDNRSGILGHYYDLSDLLAAPYSTFILFLNTFSEMSSYYLTTLVGGSLGWLQVNLQLPSFMVFVLLIVLLISLLPTPEDQTEPSVLQRSCFFLVFFSTTLGVILSMVIGHTFDTETVAMGVQGRYFLPVLPLLLLTLRTQTIQIKKESRYAIIFFLVWFNLIYLVRIYAMALNF